MAMYTERLMQHSARGDWEWHVPANKRAVLRCMTYVNPQAQSGRILLHGGVAYLFYAVIPGSSSAIPLDFRVTLYAGERLALSIFDADVSVHITGYLFDDPAGSLVADPEPLSPPELPPFAADPPLSHDADLDAA